MTSGFERAERIKQAVLYAMAIKNWAQSIGRKDISIKAEELLDLLAKAYKGEEE